MRLFHTLFLLALCSSISFSQNQPEEIIKVGLLVSEDPEKDSISLSAVHGAKLAISLMNVEVELIVRSCDGPWGVTSKQVVDFIYEDEVDAIITSVDGRNAHLAEQVATKAQKILISARATDPTLTQAFVPWFFRITPDDKKQAKALKEEIFNKQQLTNIVVIHPSDYNGSYAMAHLLKELDTRQQSQIETIFHDPLTNNFQNVIKTIKDKNSQGVVFLGRARFTSRLVKEVYQGLPEIEMFGNQTILESGEAMSKLPGQISIATSSGWPSAQGEIFVGRFIENYDYKPGIVAAYAFDAVNILVDAIQTAGSDHDQLQEQLKKTNHIGVTGTIEFDEHGNRSSPSKIANLKDGDLIERVN